MWVSARVGTDTHQAGDAPSPTAFIERILLGRQDMYWWSDVFMWKRISVLVNMLLLLIRGTGLPFRY